MYSNLPPPPPGGEASSGPTVPISCRVIAAHSNYIEIQLLFATWSTGQCMPTTYSFSLHFSVRWMKVAEVADTLASGVLRVTVPAVKLVQPSFICAHIISIHSSCTTISLGPHVCPPVLLTCVGYAGVQVIKLSAKYASEFCGV